MRASSVSFLRSAITDLFDEDEDNDDDDNDNEDAEEVDEEDEDDVLINSIFSPRSTHPEQEKNR